MYRSAHSSHKEVFYFMKNMYNKKIIGVLVLCLICIGFIFAIPTKIDTVQTTQNIEKNSTENVVSVTGSVNDVVQTPIKSQASIVSSSSAEVIKPSVTLKLDGYVGVVEIEEKTTVLEVMQKAAQDKQIIFDGKEYSGLGFFVTRVGSLVNGDGKNLMYYVNDKEASVGVSSYVLSDGDIIEWKLK